MTKAAVIYVRVEDEIKARIESIAARTGRSQAQVVDYLLRKALDINPDAIDQAIRETAR